jgi:hypothetical protein
VDVLVLINTALLALLEDVVAREARVLRLEGIAHDTGDALSAGEHDLELLEAATHCLGIEEEDNGENDGRDDEEDQVVLPANGLNGDGGCHVHDKVWRAVSMRFERVVG